MQLLVRDILYDLGSRPYHSAGGNIKNIRAEDRLEESSAMESQVSDEMHRAFQGFHDKYVSEQKEKMTRAKIIHRDYIHEIESAFRRNGICHHFEQTGNSYEAIKARKSCERHDVECDVILVIDKHEYFLKTLDDKDRPGHHWLKIDRDEKPSPQLEKVLRYWNFLGYLFADHLYVDPEKTIDLFIEELKEVIKSSKLMKGRVKLRRRGPVIQMDVHPDSGFIFWGPRLYSVDLVPAYQVNGALYVSKPLEDEFPSRMPWKEGAPNRMTWRRSVSIEEKQNMSDGVKCVLGALTVVRDREPGLESLTSYELKTLLFYEMDEERDWNDHALVLRFMSSLRRLEISLASGNLPHYFHRETNLFSSISLSILRNMRDRIKRIRSSENELMQILKSWKRPMLVLDTYSSLA